VVISAGRPSERVSRILRTAQDSTPHLKIGHFHRMSPRKVSMEPML
jgi:hypothetical protein